MAALKAVAMVERKAVSMAEQWAVKKEMLKWGIRKWEIPKWEMLVLLLV